MNAFFWTFLAFFCLSETWEIFLEILNFRHIRKHRDHVPTLFQDTITPETYRKSIAYTLEKTRFSLISRFYGIAFLWIFLLGGYFEKVDRVLQASFSGLTLSAAYVLLIGLIFAILKLPFTVYSQFVIEEKYGFNKMSAGLFVADLLKALVLSLALGLPLLYLIFWLYEITGTYWWVWAFGAFFGFQFLIAAVYPTLLAPLFNKFTPLADGPLKEKIVGLARKINFKMSGIYTIDGSKRSAHSNAYFAGMGKMRRIVLFDTLTEQLDETEILAVLGHEMGHNKLKHVQKQMILSFFVSFLGFWALAELMAWAPFYEAFRAGAPAPHKALVLFSLFSGVFTFWLTPLFNGLSRKYEYEADRFSKEVLGDATPLATGLVKMCQENLSNLTPHPWYSFYHHSHPTTVERIAALKLLKTPFSL